MLDLFIKNLMKSFKERIEQKTGWGKAEVWIEFIEAIVDASVAVAVAEEVNDD